jgi:hypothetical protein
MRYWSPTSAVRTESKRKARPWMEPLRPNILVNADQIAGHAIGQSEH